MIQSLMKGGLPDANSKYECHPNALLNNQQLIILPAVTRLAREPGILIVAPLIILADRKDCVPVEGLSWWMDWFLRLRSR